MKRDTWKKWYVRKGDIPSEQMQALETLFQKEGVRRILDVGSGTGRNILYFAQRGYEVYGFDSSSYAIKELRQKVGRRFLGRFRVWDARKRFPYENEFFDAVLSVRAFHHTTVSYIKAIISELNRVLKREGWVYVEVPTRHRVLWHARMAKLEGHPQVELEKGTWVPSTGPEKGVPHHGFTRKELEKLFSGFQIQTITMKSGHYSLYACK